MYIKKLLPGQCLKPEYGKTTREYTNRLYKSRIITVLGSVALLATLLLGGGKAYAEDIFLTAQHQWISTVDQGDGMQAVPLRARQRLPGKRRRKSE